MNRMPKWPPGRTLKLNPALPLAAWINRYASPPQAQDRHPDDRNLDGSVFRDRGALRGDPFVLGLVISMQLTLNHLLNAETGETNFTVLKALVRRRAMTDYGAICPRSIRQALYFYSSHLAQQKAAWRQQHGLPVASSSITPYGKQENGLRRSAF